MHPHEERLQDYLDDLLCREERAELEQHLAACPQCTAEVRRARELQRALGELPRELDAPPGIRAAVAAELDARPLRQEAPARRALFDRPLRSLRPHLAAAAIVLVALTSALTALLLRSDTPASVPGRELLAVERPYQRTADELRATLAGSRAGLAPETVRILEENLRVIDAALAEVRAALREDPGNGAALELLRATHERRLDLLRQARRWTQGT